MMPVALLLALLHAGGGVEATLPLGAAARERSVIAGEEITVTASAVPTRLHGG